MKNYYEIFSIDQSTATKDIQGLLYQKMNEFSTKQDEGNISDLAFMEAINLLRQAQTTFQDEASRLDYDRLLGVKVPDLDSPLTSQIQAAEKESQMKLKRLRLFQGLLLLLGCLIAFIINANNHGWSNSLTSMLIIILTVGYVFLMIKIFRHFNIFNQHTMVKFFMMLLLFIIWYFGIQMVGKLFNYDATTFDQMISTLLYCLLGSTIGILVVEWFVFQNEINLEDKIRAFKK